MSRCGLPWVSPFNDHNLILFLDGKSIVEQGIGFVLLHLLDHLGDEGSNLSKDGK
jgi:hypothetical protein